MMVTLMTRMTMSRSDRQEFIQAVSRARTKTHEALTLLAGCKTRTDEFTLACRRLFTCYELLAIVRRKVRG